MKKYFIMALAIGIFSVNVFNYSRISIEAAEKSSVSLTSNENMISNGTFDNGLDNWSLLVTDGCEGDMVSEDDALKATIENAGDIFYGFKVYYNQPLKIYKNAEYKLQFDISSTIDRSIFYTIQEQGDDYTTYALGVENIGKTPKTVTNKFVVNHNSDMNAMLYWGFGNMSAAGGTAEFPLHDVKIDNVKLILLNEDGAEIPMEEEKNIVINQVGYKCDDVKQAVFRGDMNDTEFNIISVDNGEIVYTGAIYGARGNESSGETVRYGDFSALKTPGRYKIESSSFGDSYEFNIGDDVYKNIFKDSMRFFYMQRCGENLREDLIGEYGHKACHTDLARIYGTNKKIDVSGGWHDAGDYGKYVVATSKATADLLSAYNDNKAAFGDDFNIPESGNGRDDLLDEIKLQIQWLFKMQDSESGGVYDKVTTAEFVDQFMPEQDKEELIVCPISTTATGDFAAVMAMAYETFKDIDKELADKCIKGAEKAWTYLENTPNSGMSGKNPEGIKTGEYSDEDDSDERYWPAAQLFKATKNEKYNDVFKTYAWKKIKNGYGWQNVGNYGNIAYLQCEGSDYNICQNIRNDIIRQADDIVASSKNDGYGIANGNDYCWGSNMIVNNDAIILAKAYEINHNEEYITYAKEHINYCLGKNSLAKSFVTGYGSNCVRYPFHRISQIKKEAFPGMIVGGPNNYNQDEVIAGYAQGKPNAKWYVDNYNSYSTNEVDIYWNSAFVYAMSLLGRY